MKITLVQRVTPAVCIARTDAALGERERNPSAGLHFHWQLANKLKQRDTGTIFLPPFFLFSHSHLSCCRQLVPSPTISLDGMDLSGAGTGGRDISFTSGAQHSEDILLCFTLTAKLPLSLWCYWCLAIVLQEACKFAVSCILFISAWILKCSILILNSSELLWLKVYEKHPLLNMRFMFTLPYHIMHLLL